MGEYQGFMIFEASILHRFIDKIRKMLSDQLPHQGSSPHAVGSSTDCDTEFIMPQDDIPEDGIRDFARL